MAAPMVRRLDDNHDMVWGNGARDFIGGAAATAQRVKCELLTILGECFTDLTAGVPGGSRKTATPSPFWGWRATCRMLRAS
jgi:hypothetical protein